MTTSVPIIITAVEEGQEFVDDDDVIPGPPNSNSKPAKGFLSFLNLSNGKGATLGRSHSGSGSSGRRNKQLQAKQPDELQLSSTEHQQWSGGGILASTKDLALPPEQFAKGCNLLQAAASGNLPMVQQLLQSTHANFRDYDRRTALHVAASEGHLPVCEYLVTQAGAHVNRSDRWGGSPLDDAHRHRHAAVVHFLRQHGATTGSGNRTNNLITAAAAGDVDEVRLLLNYTASNTANTTTNNNKPGVGIGAGVVNVNKGDYDQRTAMHLAAGEGHVEILRLLCQVPGANVNVEDRWKRRPLDDAVSAGHDACVQVLKQFGATPGTSSLMIQEGNPKSKDDDLDKSGKRLVDNLKVDFEEITMIDQIGSGAFGEIYKCRWRGTLVAAKIIKSAKIRRDWVNKRMLQSIKEGKDVDGTSRR